MKSFDQMIREALHLQNTILEMQIKCSLQGKQAAMDRLNLLERQVGFSAMGGLDDDSSSDDGGFDSDGRTAASGA